MKPSLSAADKMREPDLAYPALGFWKPLARDGRREGERFRGFASPVDLHQVSQGELARGLLDGSEIVDNAGRRFLVQDVRRVGRKTPMWFQFLLALFGQTDDVVHILELDLVEGPPITFAEVRQRVCAAMDRDADEWLEAELEAAVERGRASEGRGPLEAAKSAVSEAKTVQEMFDGMDAVWPR